jgi:cytochrome c-type biogenesis protein CcmH
MATAGQTLPLLALALLIGLAAALWPLRAYLRSGATARAPALVVAVAVAVGSLGVYLIKGRPGLADLPFAARIALLEEIARVAPDRLSGPQMLAILEARARKAPREPQPHYFSGVIHASEGRYEDAARAFDAALRRDPTNPDIMIELGAAMVAMNGREVTPEALVLFEQAEPLKPGDVRPVFYRALAASQSGNKKAALELWPRVLAMLPQDDPRRRMASMMIEQARS